MTGKFLIDLVRLKTRTNQYTLTDADFLLLANSNLEYLSQALLDPDEDILVLPMTTNLIAGQREYPLPQSVLARIKYVEAKLDGVKFIHLDELDLNKYKRTTDESTITQYFANQEKCAKYDIFRKSLYLYSGTITDVTAGLKLWCSTYPAPLDASKLIDNVTDLSVDPTTTTHGVPKELHNLWAKGTIIDWKESREKPIPLTQGEMNYKVEIQQAVITLRHGNQDRDLTASVPDASERGDNGANY